MQVIFFAAIAIIGALLNLFLSKKPRTAARTLEVFLMWALLITGAQAVLAFFAHAFDGPAIAKSIGWLPNNPFQLEVAFANLGLGILGITCIWKREKFWLATILMATAFNWGAAYVHIDQIIRFQNFAPNNAGPILYQDIITPVVLIGLYVAYKLALRRQEAMALEKTMRAA